LENFAWKVLNDRDLSISVMFNFILFGVFLKEIFLVLCIIILRKSNNNVTTQWKEKKNPLKHLLACSNLTSSCSSFLYKKVIESMVDQTDCSSSDPYPKSMCYQLNLVLSTFLQLPWPNAHNILWNKLKEMINFNPSLSLWWPSL